MSLVIAFVKHSLLDKLAFFPSEGCGVPPVLDSSPSFFVKLRVNLECSAAAAECDLFRLPLSLIQIFAEKLSNEFKNKSRVPVMSLPGRGVAP